MVDVEDVAIVCRAIGHFLVAQGVADDAMASIARGRLPADHDKPTLGLDRLWAQWSWVCGYEAQR